MPKSLTLNEVNHRLDQKKISLIGEFVNARHKSAFKCLVCGYEWTTTMGSVLNCSGCRACGITNSKMTTESVNEKIQHQGVRLVDDYVDNNTSVRFQCTDGHTWQTKPRTVLSGRGCPTCFGNAPLDKELINKRYAGNGVRLIGEYTNTRTETEFMCNHGHVWTTAPQNLRKGRFCPQCAKSGYNQHKPGFFYILLFGDFVKYGISHNPKKRFRSYSGRGEYTVAAMKWHTDGKIALDMEREIKSKFGGKFVTRERFPDGYTETLCSSRLTELIEIVNLVTWMPAPTPRNAGSRQLRDF